MSEKEIDGSEEWVKDGYSQPRFSQWGRRRGSFVSNDTESYQHEQFPPRLFDEQATPKLDDAATQVAPNFSEETAQVAPVSIALDEEQKEEEGEEEEKKDEAPYRPCNFVNLYMKQENHVPWMKEFYIWMMHTRHDQYPYGLYQADMIKDDPELPFDAHNYKSLERWACFNFEQVKQFYYCDLFLQNRLYKDRSVSKWPFSPSIQVISWNLFVDSMIHNQRQWYIDFYKRQEEYFKYTPLGQKMNIHMRCVDLDLGCTVLKQQKCPMCFGGSKKMAMNQRLKIPDPDLQALVYVT